MPEDWRSKPAKNRQKDKDARWMKKHDRSYFGYKSHIGVDRRHKFVRRYVVDASVHPVTNRAGNRPSALKKTMADFQHLNS